MEKQEQTKEATRSGQCKWFFEEGSEFFLTSCGLSLRIKNIDHPDRKQYMFCPKCGKGIDR
tara:strand:+ start:927 stop:1109 length:183 start_codon:yes stop_codon:yes gene_type:complete